MMSFTHTRPHPPTEERLPRWQSNIIIAVLAALSWISVIGIGWAALILWRALT